MLDRARSVPRRRLALCGLALLVIALIAAFARVPHADASQSKGKEKWTYLAMGDSHTYGPAEVCGDCTPYPILLDRRIAEKERVSVKLLNASQWNHAHGSQASRRDQERQLGRTSGSNPRSRLPNARPAPRKAIAQADLITIGVGFNSLPWITGAGATSIFDAACRAAIISPFVADMDAILSEIDVPQRRSADRRPGDDRVQRRRRRRLGQHGLLRPGGAVRKARRPFVPSSTTWLPGRALWFGVTARSASISTTRSTARTARSLSGRGSSHRRSVISISPARSVLRLRS